MNSKNVKHGNKSSNVRNEMEELLSNAKAKKGTQLVIDMSSDSGLKEVDEIRTLLSKKSENPLEKYNIYYKGINKLLRKYLPKGVEFKKSRDIIYDEKNIFLCNGKKKSDNNGIRGMDGRMGYQEGMSEILDIVAEWVSTSQSPIDLYDSIYNLNEKFGYGHEVYDDTSKSYNKSIKKGLTP